MKTIVYYPLFGGQYKKHLTQREDVAQYIQNGKAELVAVFEEKKPGLRELRKAIEKAEKTGALLVFSRLGYLTRNLNFLKVLASHGANVTFIALDDDHFNPNTFTVYLGQAKDVWHDRRNKIKDGMAKAKAEGKKFGAARRGHFNKSNEHLRGWPKAIVESAKVRRQRDIDAYRAIIPMIEELLEKETPYTQIAVELNEAGHCTTTGAPFSAPTVFRIYKRHRQYQSHGGLNGRARGKGVGRKAVHAAADR